MKDDLKAKLAATEGVSLGPWHMPPGEREYLHGQLSADGKTSFRLLVKGEIAEAELG